MDRRERGETIRCGGWHIEILRIERETERGSLIDRETFYNNKRAHRIFYWSLVLSALSRVIRKESSGETNDGQQRIHRRTIWKGYFIENN